MNFYNNTKSHEAGCHNIYLLQTVNMDGDVVDEKFAVNLITNVGMDNSFCNEGLNQFRDLYIGSGSGTPSVVDTGLFNLITTSPAIVSDSTHYILPMTYDSANGIIIGTRNILSCYFDYNISGITKSVNITEIGYKNYSSLLTHALVCDRSGNVTYITKNVNERLNIKIYVAANVKESLITDAYANGIYISGDPQAFLRHNRNTTTSTYYVTANYFMGYAKSPSLTTGVHKDPQYIVYANNGNDKIYQFDIKSEDIVLEDKHDCIAMTGVNNLTNFGYYYNYSWQFRAYGELIVFTEDKMNNSEECSCECIVTNSYLSSSISSSFGTKGYDVWSGIGNLPCTDFIISSVNMYNHLTQSWDIAEAFDQTANAYMGNSMIIHSNIGIVLNGKNTFDCRVYTNTRTDIPITSFNNNQVVMYASDKFWDVSTYKLISDPNAVPASLQKKRYYITTKDLTAQTSTSLYPTRDYIEHKIVIDPIITLDITPNSMFNSRQIPISSDINGWFLIGNTLVYPFLTGTPSYILTPILRTLTSYNSSIMVFSNDNKILMFGDCDSSYSASNYTEALKLRIYNVSNGTVAPTYNDITMDFGAGVTNFNNMALYRSFTTNGFAVCWHSTSNTSVIIDIRNDTPTQKRLVNTKFASAMAYTNYCVYKNMDLSKNTFEIYDMTSDTIVDTFDIPDDVAYVVNGVNCWKNNIYIHVTAAGASSVFIYQMDEGMLTHIDTNVIGINYFTSGSSLNNMNRMVSCFDDCVIFGSSSSNSNYETYMFMQGDPTKPIHIGYSATRCQVKSCKYGKVLPLLIDQKGLTISSGTTISVESSSRYMVLDLGKMVDDNKGYTMNTFPYKHYPTTTYDCNYAALLGDYVVYLANKTSKIQLIPIELWMMHKVTGTTRTIQSYNNPKKILGKTFNIRISNTGRWTDVKPSG